ncbi:putative bifunctional diguanylate cyclase/phosphodiesterase [Lyngbya confervoides]|uniref:EAL domain-containing protein n=1 Tax=Lyngbya confervoides BDU141951 TaxID=1574623 RepID=A0ABD4T8L4_9CYAN|nr:EAL domain-containing protein [Lyngbya confervoides]MCM1984840.1 EAL domain-containing protein [Lyngbya confervoides BDU141951]
MVYVGEQSQINVLVVEDEAIVALDLQRRLERLGYQVPHIFASGHDVLDRLAQLQCDLVLMDIRLPGELNGIETAERIQQQRNIPIIFLTAFTDPETIEQARRLEPVGYLVKPFSEPSLNSTIQVGLYRHQMRLALQSQKARLKTILDSISDAVVATDSEGRITFMNPVAETLTAWMQHQAEGYPIDQVIQCFQHGPNAEEIPVPNPALEALVSGTPVSLPEDVVLRNRAQKNIPIDDSAAPILEPDGRISGAVMVFRDISERIQYRKQLLHRALYDPLTGLPNRELLLNRLEQAMVRFVRYPADGYALLFIDLDRFKAVNDGFGHLAGDDLLKQVGERLQRCLRPSDTVARLGGDEFAALLEHAADLTQVRTVAARILQTLGDPFGYRGQQFYVSASIGIVYGETAYRHPQDVIRDADIAMYHAKTSGKGRYTIFNSQMKSQLLQRVRLENDLRQALANQELGIRYQPIVALASRRVVGFEALMQWHHPTEGIIAPDRFIPLAEELGLIQDLDLWILRQACAQLQRWRDDFPDCGPLTVSVNFSGKIFSHAHCFETITQIFKETQLPPSALVIEITESILIEHSEAAEQLLENLKCLGVEIHLDDFGTGYSSLSYLHHFPIDALKIDRSFVDILSQDEQHSFLISTIVTLAHAMDLPAIAEGIETQDQYDMIQALGCDLGQGYLFHRPQSPAQISALLRSLTPATE